MNNKKSIEWFSDYISNYKNTLFDDLIYQKLSEIKLLFEETNKNKNKILIFGNGGSAAMASHCAVDLTKNANIRSLTLNEYDLITCFANDFGFENWVSQAIKFYADIGDIIVLISSSGKSINMVNAADTANEMNLNV